MLRQGRPIYVWLMLKDVLVLIPLLREKNWYFAYNAYNVVRFALTRCPQ